MITSLDVGGAQSVLLSLLSRLDRSEFPSEVISLRPSGRMAERFRDPGIGVSSLEMGDGPNDLRRLGGLVLRFRRSRPALVQTWMYHADLFGGLAAKAAGRIPVVWNLRQSAMDPAGTKRATRLVIELCARLSRHVPDRIVCASESGRIAHAAIGFDSRQMEVIRNGVDLSAFQPSDAAPGELRAELGLAANAALVVLAARFDPQKDHRTFFAAAARLRRERRGLRFVLCGEGITPSNRALADSIAEAGLAYAVHLLGPRRDIARVIAGCDLATSSSAFGEGFPNAIAEAMACEVPCVATRVGDAADVIGDCGELVPPGDAAALAAAWKKLLDLEPPARRELGRRARKRIVEHFDVSRMSERYAELYREVASIA